MSGKKKSSKVPGFMRSVLAENLAKLLKRDYGKEKNETAQLKALAKDAGLAYSTVQRVYKAEVGASLDNIEMLAEAFDLSVYQLMLPALDVGNAQVVKGASEEEKRLYRRWRQSKLGQKEEEPTTN